MNKYLTNIFLVSFLILASFSSCYAEKINSFNSQIIINKDGTINVSENILYDFEGLEKHGIYRDIPFVKIQNNKKYEMTLVVDSVVDEKNNPYSYQLVNSGEKVQIKIGDVNQLVSGTHDYVVNYTVKGALGYYQSFDELYWNVTGNDWQVPIGQLSTHIFFKGADNITDNPSYAVKCFEGVAGSTSSDCQTRIVNNGIQISTPKIYAPGEGLTIAFKFPKNLVATLLPKEYKTSEDKIVQFFQSPIGKIFAFFMGLVVLFWYLIYPIKIFVNWWQNGRDPKIGQDKALTSWFDPPKFGTRFLSPEESGTIIDESADEKDISAMIIYLAQQGHFVIKEYDKEKFKLIKKRSKNKLSSYQQYFIDSIFAGSVELDLDTENISSTCQKTKEQIYESMTNDGMFTSNPNKIRIYYYVIIAAAAFTFNFQLILSAIIFGLNMVKRTSAGVRLKYEALSLRNFLSSQDRQLEFQAKNQMYFEKLLPFAVAFGVEKIWIKRFEKMKFSKPDWYDSNSTFTNYLFINSLHLSLVTSTMPDSASGSSSGFSGGGGGGGGGGSW